VRVALLVTRSHHLLESAVAVIKRLQLDVVTIDTASSEFHEGDDRILSCDVVFNFLSPRILRSIYSARPTVNFHPGPPEWPGRGGASLAIFSGDSSYGATAHMVEKRVDAGPIVRVARFVISPGEGCASVFNRAEHACLELMGDCSEHLVREGRLPAPTGDGWRRRPVTRKEFERWLIADANNPEELHSKVRAGWHPRFRGPYVFIHGYRFSLDTTPTGPVVSSEQSD